MRKFLAALMAVFMLTAALAVLPASAAAVDGTAAGDVAAMNLVVTEVLADTKSNNVTMASKNAFQYIEIHNRGTEPVNVYEYAIVRALYKEKDKGNAWPTPKKFDGKIVLDPGSIYGHYLNKEVAGIEAYSADSMYACSNADDGVLEAGKTALIWIWNKDTKDVFGANQGTTTEQSGIFTAFRNHYKAHGAEIPADVKIFATFGVTGVGESFELNTTANYMYALVKDGAGDSNTFDINTEVAFTQDTAGGAQPNAKVVTMFKFGTALKYTSTVENRGPDYTLANQAPQLNNANMGKTDANYVDAGLVDGFKEMACINNNTDKDASVVSMTPGKLLPIQWADIDPDHAPADVKGTDANWKTTVWNAYLTANKLVDDGSKKEEEDLGQSKVDVDRDDLGNQGQNKAGEWTFVTWVDEATGETKYGRYKTEGGSMDTVVEISKEVYDLAMAKLAEAEKGEGLGIWLWVIIGGAAVVVLGGAAVVLIIVLKKKNKNVATDDVAGFVEIIDEEAAPAEDVAPAEEAAPAEENTEE